LHHRTLAAWFTVCAVGKVLAGSPCGSHPVSLLAAMVNLAVMAARRAPSESNLLTIKPSKHEDR
jgi:hypothetical protein